MVSLEGFKPMSSIIRLVWFSVFFFQTGFFFFFFQGSLDTISLTYLSWPFKGVLSFASHSTLLEPFPWYLFLSPLHP